ncbi:MAG: helix-turn-helix domain-containing protein [Actinomycetota bacterium]
MTRERDESNSGKPSPPRLLTVQELAELLQVPVKTIYTWRYRGGGPPGIAVGRHLRFRSDDVAAWLDDHTSPMPRGRVPSVPDARKGKGSSRRTTEIRHRHGLPSATLGAARSIENP